MNIPALFVLIMAIVIIVTSLLIVVFFFKLWSKNFNNKNIVVLPFVAFMIDIIFPMVALTMLGKNIFSNNIFYPTMFFSNAMFYIQMICVSTIVWNILRIKNGKQTQ